LEADRKEADEKIVALSQAIYQYSQCEKAKNKKPLKPFVSTVRSNTQFPDPAFISDFKEKCGCGASRKSGVQKEIEKLRSDLKHSEDILSVLKKQEAEKDREIQRLNCLFVGGRPPSALAKDCCYKDVSKITEDVSVLQRDKIELTRKLTEYEDRHETLYQKWKQQKVKITQLESYISEISDAALYVEREANLRIKNQNRDIKELKENLSKTTADGKSLELKKLKRSLKEKNQQEQKLMFEIEYLKNKLNENEQQISSKNSQLVAELVKERDILQSMLKMFMERSDVHPKSGDECSLHRLYCQLKDKETQIIKLQEELRDIRCERSQPSSSHGALSMTNSIRKAECERDCALNKVQSLKIENESLNDKIRIINDSKINENKRIIQLEETITKLKLEIQDLHTSKTPAFQTIKSLREENCELQIKLRSADEDYQKLNCTYNQVKMLSQQTESVLMNVQNQLEYTKCELSERDSQICCLNKSNECLKDQIEKLTTEISKLKTLKSTVEREKEFYMMSLDKKCEKLQSAESKVETMSQLREANRMMKVQIDDINCEVKRLESIVCDTRSENQCLCKQLETTKHHLTNAIHENGRMADELASITAELNATKKCLNDSQRESENIRSKLQSYIHEIERIDGLIAIKDNERKQTLLQYKDLECDNSKLMEKFQHLDQETSESKRIISEYQHRITVLSDQVQGKEYDIETLEKQVIDLSTEIEMLRSANTKLHVDLEAQRNLCDKLDIQKEKQEAELIEYQLSVRELLEKNDKLRDQILIMKEGDAGGGDTHISASYHPTM
jgi:centrosomal protein CEP135